MRDTKLESLRNLIYEIILLVQPEIKSVNFDYYKYITISFLKRYVYNLYGLAELIPKYKSNKSLIITLSPILRMGLSDFITQCYLLSASEVGEKNDFNKIDYEKRAEQVLFSPIIKEMNRIENEKKAGILKNSEYKKAVLEAYKVSSIAFSKIDFQSAEYEMKIKSDISPAKMFRILSQNSFFKKYNASYTLYDYYSKMEHFGGLSNMIDSLEYKNERENINRIIHCVLFISKGIEFCIPNLESENQEFILNQLQKIGKKFIEPPLEKNCW